MLSRNIGHRPAVPIRALQPYFSATASRAAPSAAEVVNRRRDAETPRGPFSCGGSGLPGPGVTGKISSQHDQERVTEKRKRVPSPGKSVDAVGRAPPPAGRHGRVERLEGPRARRTGTHGCGRHARPLLSPGLRTRSGLRSRWPCPPLDTCGGVDPVAASAVARPKTASGRRESDRRPLPRGELRAGPPLPEPGALGAEGRSRDREETCAEPPRGPRARERHRSGAVGRAAACSAARRPRAPPRALSWWHR